MGNVVPAKNLPEWVTNPQLSKSLDSHDFRKHRAMVAVELEVLAKKFDRFGWERDRGQPAHDRLVSDWMGALSDFTLPEIQEACRQAVSNNPDKMPNEGHIRRIVLKNRKGVTVPVSQPEEEPREPPCSSERAAEIMQQVGFQPKRFGGDQA